MALPTFAQLALSPYCAASASASSHATMDTEEHKSCPNSFFFTIDFQLHSNLPTNWHFSQKLTCTFNQARTSSPSSSIQKEKSLPLAGEMSTPFEQQYTNLHLKVDSYTWHILPQKSPLDTSTSHFPFSPT
jgi:hypothetical protein